MTKQLDSVYIRKDEIVHEIDRYAWKHSWHLPRNSSGYTDWFNNKTKEDCRRVIEQHRDGAIQIAANCERLLREIDWTPVILEEEEE